MDPLVSYGMIMAGAVVFAVYAWAAVESTKDKRRYLLEVKKLEDKGVKFTWWEKWMV